MRAVICPRCDQTRRPDQFVTNAGRVMHTCQPCRTAQGKRRRAPYDAITRDQYYT
jgi:hypothetical protein